MTDRVSALVVVLEKNVRADDAESLMKAIGTMRGVTDVTAHVSDVTQCVADSRARMKLVEVLQAMLNGGSS